MKTAIAILVSLILICIQFSFSQDIDVFKRDLNDHFNIPQIPDSMTVDEFNILSTNLRLMDAMEAVVVPGIIHFKVKDKTTGWILVGTRLAGYGGLAYVNFHKDGLWSDVFNFQALNSEESKTDYYIALASLGLITSSYLYDWIHGRSLLDKKQQKIRFKYAVRLQQSSIYSPSNSSSLISELAIQIQF